MIVTGAFIATLLASAARQVSLEDDLEGENLWLRQLGQTYRLYLRTVSPESLVALDVRMDRGLDIMGREFLEEWSRSGERDAFVQNAALLNHQAHRSGQKDFVVAIDHGSHRDKTYLHAGTPVVVLSMFAQPINYPSPKGTSLVTFWPYGAKVSRGERDYRGRLKTRSIPAYKLVNKGEWIHPDIQSLVER